VTPLLSVQGVTKRYGSLEAVAGVSLEVAEGAIVGLIGPNGAGKTTLMNLIAGSVGEWTGEIHFRGRPLRRLRPHDIARLGISRTFQVAQPFTEMSLVENVMVGALFGGRERLGVAGARSKALAILDATSLADRADRPAASLNPAERKRLEIAKALSSGPELVLLDELMAGLNATEVDAMMGLIGQLRDSGLSILMVEHVMRAVTSLADRVVVLDLGRKVAEGPPAEVLGDERVIGAYLGRRGIRRERA
jgi:branched-chain amino acid transport system ATP-binding protein